MNDYHKRRAAKLLKIDPNDQSLFIPPYKVSRVSPDPHPVTPLGALEDVSLTFPELLTIWQTTRGAGVKIAVLDSGYDLDHPALPHQLAVDFTNSPVGAADEGDLHGTHVAGIIAAGNNIGAAPAASLYLGKVVRDNSGSLANLEKGINWAVEQGVNIINISLGTLNDADEIKAAIAKAIKKNILVICAAGNRGEQGLDFPGKYTACISVGATNTVGNRWIGSGLEGESAIGEELDIVTRGASIRSTIPDDQYGDLSGTSMAAPFVTGVVALALAKPNATNPIRNQADLFARLSQTSSRHSAVRQFGRFGSFNPLAFFQSV
jgi:subtilisin family serine protease